MDQEICHTAESSRKRDLKELSSWFRGIPVQNVFNCFPEYTRQR